MSETLAAYADGRRLVRTHFHAACFKITRSDGTVFRFTDHDARLSVGLTGAEGTTETFVPAGGWSASAMQSEGQLAEKNFDAVGIISDDAITQDDLRAGLFREAQVSVYLVDWRYPWKGPLKTERFWIDDTRYTAESWRASMSGLARFLKQPVGRVFGVLCDAKLGDSRCGFNLASVKVSGKTIDSVTTQRVVFVTTTTSLSTTNGYYSLGRVVWTSGANDGLASEILSHEHNQPSAGKARITLWKATPYDMAGSDQFTIEPGCDKSAATCKAKFSNLANHRGFPYLPGTDAMLETPP